VIFVTIELRHAPWVGWFRDLSAPDPSSIFNLFGLFPWDAPAAGSITALIFIGVLPILLGVSMWLQQKLNPTPSDPTQKMIFAWMPWVFMFMLGSFASGRHYAPLGDKARCIWQHQRKLQAQPEACKHS